MAVSVQGSTIGLNEAETKKRAAARRNGRWAGRFMLAWSRTLRVECFDHCGFLEKRPDHPLIHVVWHNAIFAWPYVYQQNWSDRKGAVLTSASRDGEVVAGAMEVIGLSTVRGSSSRRGGAALIELKKWIQRGHDIAVTPDGPRGPKHVLQPGVITLAQNLGVPVLPVRLIYDRPWRLKTWDRFQIPRPFSRVQVHIGPYLSVPPGLDREAFERERQRIEVVMQEGLEEL